MTPKISTKIPSGLIRRLLLQFLPISDKSYNRPNFFLVRSSKFIEIKLSMIVRIIYLIITTRISSDFFRDFFKRFLPKLLQVAQRFKLFCYRFLQRGLLDKQNSLWNCQKRISQRILYNCHWYFPKNSYKIFSRNRSNQFLNNLLMLFLDKFLELSQKIYYSVIR